MQVFLTCKLTEINRSPTLQMLFSCMQNYMIYARTLIYLITFTSFCAVVNNILGYAVTNFSMHKTKRKWCTAKDLKLYAY